MGTAKALLELNGRSFLSRLIELASSTGLEETVVVTGVHDAVIREALAGMSGASLVRIVFNADHVKGQLSSLLAGLDHLSQEPDAVVMLLVDHPFVRPATVERMLDAFERTGAPVVYPTFEQRKGHPVLFGREALARLRATPFDEGARAVVRAFGERCVEVAVDDPGVRLDIDTPEDFERAARMLDED